MPNDTWIYRMTFRFLRFVAWAIFFLLLSVTFFTKHLEYNLNEGLVATRTVSKLTHTLFLGMLVHSFIFLLWMCLFMTNACVRHGDVDSVCYSSSFTASTKSLTPTFQLHPEKNNHLHVICFFLLFCFFLHEVLFRANFFSVIQWRVWSHKSLMALIGPNTHLAIFALLIKILLYYYYYYWILA